MSYTCCSPEALPRDPSRGRGCGRNRLHILLPILDAKSKTRFEFDDSDSAAREMPIPRAVLFPLEIRRTLCTPRAACQSAATCYTTAAGQLRSQRGGDGDRNKPRRPPSTAQAFFAHPGLSMAANTMPLGISTVGLVLLLIGFTNHLRFAMTLNRARGKADEMTTS